MKNLLLMMSVLAFSAHATNSNVYITVDSDSIDTSRKSISSVKKIASNDGISILKINESQIELLSKLMHDKFNRCGGFVMHDSLDDAREVLAANSVRKFSKSMLFADYSITEQDTVKNYVSQTSEFEIRSVIEKLSSYQNRYYQSKTGVESQKWVKSKWETLASGRSDVSVELFNHSAWKQPSVIMTIEGNSKANEIVIVGGHGDSIAGYFNRSKARAPGADDNASGIATITETIRVLMENGFKPERTIKFMSYAAEEVGLRGSKEIADSFRSKGAQVVGVIQLDMTNHKGSEDLDIVFMDDFTNKAQNEFLSKLIDEYVKVSWGYSRCGYGCSDHASWHNAGYPASMPFESTMEDINHKIHTDKDLISNSNSNANHAEKFAKLAISFVVELGN